MSSIVLPSTVEELNYLQYAQSMYNKSDHTDKGFENILVAGYKREVSLPEGVNNWDVHDYDSYLNFEENVCRFEADDSIVPTGAGLQNHRNESFTESFPSNVEDKSRQGVKTFSTVCVDSGSTCIASEHSYVSPSPQLYGGLEEEETYHNLSTYFNQNSDVHDTDSLPSISPSDDSSHLEYSVLNDFSAISHCSQDSFPELSFVRKRPAGSPDPDTLPPPKRSHEARQKNNLSSKNCRKTRKERQTEMDTRVVELEREREQLNSTIEMLERSIKAHHVHLCSILRQRGGSLSGNVC